MASLTNFANEQAVETSKSNVKIGFIGQVILQAGIVPRFAKAVDKPKCFQAYEVGKSADDTKADCAVTTKRVTGDDHTEYFPCIWVQVVPDTSLTPNSRYQNSFLSIEVPNAKNPRTQKQHGKFTLRYMSPEIDDLVGKKFWAHIAWQRLTEEFGGDLTLLGDDASDELSVLITYLENKKEATKLAKLLRDQEVDTDSMCMALGYPVQETRDALRAAAAASKEGKADDKPQAPTLTEIGVKTTQHYMTVQGFFDGKVTEFLQQNYDKAGGDLAVVSEKCGAEVGDIAIALNKPEFFRGLMDETGLSDAEAVIKVAEQTGLANASDLAIFVGVTEAPF